MQQGLADFCPANELLKWYRSSQSLKSQNLDKLHNARTLATIITRGYHLDSFPLFNSFTGKLSFPLSDTRFPSSFHRRALILAKVSIVHRCLKSPGRCFISDLLFSLEGKRPESPTEMNLHTFHTCERTSTDSWLCLICVLSSAGYGIFQHLEVRPWRKLASRKSDRVMSPRGASSLMSNS